MAPLCQWLGSRMAPKHVSMAPMVPMAPEPAVPEQTAPEPARCVVAAAAEAAADVASSPRHPPPSPPPPLPAPLATVHSFAFKIILVCNGVSFVVRRLKPPRAPAASRYRTRLAVTRSGGANAPPPNYSRYPVCTYRTQLAGTRSVGAYALPQITAGIRYVPYAAGRYVYPVRTVRVARAVPGRLASLWCRRNPTCSHGGMRGNRCHSP